MFFFWTYPVISITNTKPVPGNYLNNSFFSVPILSLAIILGITAIVLFILGGYKWFLSLTENKAWKIVFHFALCLFAITGFLIFIGV